MLEIVNVGLVWITVAGVAVLFALWLADLYDEWDDKEQP